MLTEYSGGENESLNDDNKEPLKVVQTQQFKCKTEELMIEWLFIIKALIYEYRHYYCD